MKTAQEIFRDMYAESKKPGALCKFYDAKEQFEQTHQVKAPYKNLSSFKSAISNKSRKS